MRAPRLADVAARAGVSEATVSRVLNGKPGVSEATRERVLTALDVDVTWLPGCTREDPTLYSYRRDGQTGRFAGVVGMTP